MTQDAGPKRETWGGRTAFIVAAISSAIGLGNIWRFPGVAYDNGGGAFLIPYIVAFFVAGLPILFLDYALGHRYRAAPPLAFRRAKRALEPLGWWQVAACYLITLYYSVIIAWALAYMVKAANQSWGDDAGGYFSDTFLQLQSADDGFSLTFVAGVFIPLALVWTGAIVVLCFGIRRGLERANKITLPTLVVLFSFIVAYSLTLDGAAEGLNAFFTPSWSALGDATVWIAAFGHIFFSFSIAFGIMITYSSYVRRKTDLTGSGTVVAFSNCGFEILAGIGVFATLGFLAFQQSADGATVAVADLEGIDGVGLAFITFPTLLSEMPAGVLIGVVFFACLVFAGFTSLLSLLQVVSSAIQDKTGWSPRSAALAVGVSTAAPSILLFSTTSSLHVLDILDAFVNNIGVVASAIAMVLCVAYVAKITPRLRDQLNAVSSWKVGRIWMAMITVITPLVLIAVLYTGAASYVTDGYEGYPRLLVGVAGWGSLGLAVVFSFAMSYRRYRRPDADDFTPEDTDALAAEMRTALENARRRQSTTEETP